mmetsp:Transcript_23674/g.73442  ORF Transcript_23674/g.73442 Transcript_23674/m.73442 type:complete len:200 (-) Transcript_23674:816-1415(-)
MAPTCHSHASNVPAGASTLLCVRRCIRGICPQLRAAKAGGPPRAPKRKPGPPCWPRRLRAEAVARTSPRWTCARQRQASARATAECGPKHCSPLWPPIAAGRRRREGVLAKDSRRPETSRRSPRARRAAAVPSAVAVRPRPPHHRPHGFMPSPACPGGRWHRQKLHASPLRPRRASPSAPSAGRPQGRRGPRASAPPAT